uniref:Uncharacterized protein n=1 Tax=Arundo donax TaxID=35708 RepID=A0A0A9FQ43_ARUDO
MLLLQQLAQLHYKIRDLIQQDGNSPLLPLQATLLLLQIVNWAVDLISSYWIAFMMKGPTGRGNNSSYMVRQLLTHS